MQFDITCTAVIPFSTETLVRTMGIDHRVLSHPEGSRFSRPEMKL